MRSAEFRSERPTAGPGQPSTKMMAAARRLAGLAAASLPAIRRLTEVARRAVRPRRPARQRVAPCPRGGRRLHVSGRPSLETVFFLDVKADERRIGNDQAAVIDVRQLFLFVPAIIPATIFFSCVALPPHP